VTTCETACEDQAIGKTQGGEMSFFVVVCREESIAF
jgi:hypothetical protein